ncbi:ACT domain-containing protein [Apilactobacillus kunkeei]|uniref:ACT domain-containing protein n=1 Tax=Apilactobacillus TaxID=2767877 RepID=UPI0018DE43E8|nr:MULTISPECIES: ACT domain-containing protein [Apilactobacillus]MBI0091543.1 ACT domain-containing protein [Lactobacillus sp. M0345]MCK8618800.1 ACT domain-containing protein [Apilactobacillus kunkeei]MCX0325481.1 ACT domain-containing protein [Apilactobacillus kunkeei]MDN2612640.1 ACT domain-containing protein [Apilactobacillus sp. EABW-1NA]UZX33901.1 ACT domain-containing protein [Apilactobacillus kunkeei]
MSKYYIVDDSLLPEAFGKVIEARKMIDNGEVKNVSEAVKQVGISRASYYKYKDYVYEAQQSSWQRKAVISFLLSHKSGILSKVLNSISNRDANILTINQNIPINDSASVVISLDLSQMDGTIDELIADISAIDGTNKVNLVAVE